MLQPRNTRSYWLKPRLYDAARRAICKYSDNDGRRQIWETKECESDVGASEEVGSPNCIVGYREHSRERRPNSVVRRRLPGVAWSARDRSRLGRCRLYVVSGHSIIGRRCKLRPMVVGRSSSSTCRSILGLLANCLHSCIGAASRYRAKLALRERDSGRRAISGIASLHRKSFPAWVNSHRVQRESNGRDLDGWPRWDTICKAEFWVLV